MSIETAIATGLKSHLASDNTLTGITAPVYAHIASQGAAYPLIIYSVINTEIEKTINQAASEMTLTRLDFDLSIYSESMAQRALLMTSVKNKFHGFRGSLGTENLDIRESFLQSLTTFNESDLTGSDDQLYRATLSFQLFYNWS